MSATQSALQLNIELQDGDEENTLVAHVVGDPYGEYAASLHVYRSGPLATALWIEVIGVTVAPKYRRHGLASALMAELERLAPGVPINHKAVTREGLAWNESYYGAPLPGEHTPVHEGDPDWSDFDHWSVSVMNDDLFRAGWTRDRVRITDPFA